MSLLSVHLVQSFSRFHSHTYYRSTGLTIDLPNFILICLFYCLDLQISLANAVNPIIVSLSVRPSLLTIVPMYTNSSVSSVSYPSCFLLFTFKVLIFHSFILTPTHYGKDTQNCYLLLHYVYKWVTIDRCHQRNPDHQVLF